ncbi:MAG: cation diffusion facilitator family transporter [Chloroflexi bacterium]|nr:cation diffusion facilitator family transporter [Chloroflexota bacterium]
MRSSESHRKPSDRGRERRITQAAVEGWGWGSIGVNVALSLLNLGIAVASGSLAVAAEMLHNLVDLMASVAVLVGLKISRRRSESFPYGLYKVENVIAVGVAGLILFTAFEIIREALFAHQRQTTVNPWMLAGVMLSAVIPLVFSHSELRAGKAANSPSLIAEAQEYRAHIFSSGVVLISLIGHIFGLSLDRPAALLVVFFIARTGWELLKDGMRVLLDASLDAETLAQVRQIIENDPATTQIKTLTGRNSGRYRFLEAEVTLRKDDLKKAHAVSQRIEQAIRAEVPHVERVLIHYEPTGSIHRRDAFPLANPDGRLSEHFGEAPYFALVTLRRADEAVEKQEVVENPHREVSKAKGIRVAEWLVSQKVDRVVLKESLQGKGPEYVFAAAGVQMILTEAETVSLALDALGS